MSKSRQHLATKWYGNGTSTLKCKCGEWQSDSSKTVMQQREDHRAHRRAMGETTITTPKLEAHVRIKAILALHTADEAGVCPECEVFSPCKTFTWASGYVPDEE